MKNTNNANKNIFAEEIRNITEGGKAWTIGDSIFSAAYEKAYYNVDKNTLIEFLKKASTLQNDKGFVQLYVDNTMPSDARVGIIYQPSYAIAVVSIYCYENFRSDFTSELEAFLKKLLATFEYGIIGHGFDADETVRKTMEMLSIESVKNFVEEQPHFSDVFTNIIKHYVEKYDAILSSGVKILEGFDRKTSHNVAWNKIVSFWKGNTEAVFVYGTLRNGERANYMLDGSEYCGKFYLKDCSMYNLGSYPGIKEDKGEYVIGEVYFISSEVLRCLDKYEGEGSLYNRKMVDVFNGEEKVECWAYFYAHEVDVKQRMLQPWGASNEKVWYAAYGSNLSEDRFGCYIRRGVCRQNGIYYKGCTDTTKWDASEFRKFPGRLYFGNSSASWDGKGVAFFDENGCQAVQMRLYRITREQFLQVRSQEGKSDSWYGRIVCLGIDDEGTEIYTLTSKTLREENAPADKYLDLIKNALINEGGYTEKTVQSYFSSMTDDGLGENDAD